MRRPLPSIEHVARALLVQGARDAAVDLLEAASARGGDDRPRCQALLATVRTRPNDCVSGPPLALDAGLVETLAAHGRLVEAWAVTRGASVGNTVAGVEIADALAAVMQPVDVPEPWRTRWMEIVATGSTAEIAAIERQVLAGEVVPSSLIERLRVAWRLLRGYWSSGATDEGSSVQLPLDVRRAIGARLDARDLVGALAATRAAVEETPGAASVAMALARLFAATERLMSDEGPARGAPQGSTLPLEGPGLALLQVRMGNFDDAERGFRHIVEERPADHVSRDRLADLLLVRRALGHSPGDAAQDAPARVSSPSPDWLDKRTRKASVAGWASSTRARPSAVADWSDDDQSTSVIRPDEEAELHIKGGSPDKALAIYRRLVEKYPDRPRFRERLVEVEAMVEARREAAPPAAPPARAPDDAELPRTSSDATVVVKQATRRATLEAAETKTFARDKADGPDPNLSFEDSTSVEPWEAIATERAPARASGAVAVHRIVRVG